MRQTLRSAKTVLGLPDTFKLRNEQDYRQAMAAWKALTIAARRAGDDHAAALLSNYKQLIKQRFATCLSYTCPVCGGGKNRGAIRCQMCAYVHRRFKNQIKTA